MSLVRLIGNYFVLLALIYFVCLRVPALDLQHAMRVFRWQVAPDDPDDAAEATAAAAASRTLTSARSISIVAIEKRYQELAQLHASRNHWQALQELNHAREILLDGRQPRKKK
jgi:hypothetical protein